MSRPVDAEPRPPGLRGATRVLLERELDLAWSGGGGPLLACGFFQRFSLYTLKVGGRAGGLHVPVRAWHGACGT